MKRSATLEKPVISQGELDILFHGTLPTEEDIIQRDHRVCGCELTYVHRKRHAALGTAIEIRLCCMAKFIEKKFNLPPGTFFRVMDFQPSWEWDCNKEHVREKTRADGTVEKIISRDGPPPRWLRERMEKKGIRIKNDPKARRQRAQRR